MAEAKFNMRNPAVKRIMQEVKEMQKDPSTDYMSLPLEEDIFEWQFAIHGPRETPFEGGIYHGRIILPSDYPFKPPAFMLLTPSGRFEVQTKICLSISAHHPEHWQPSWSVRTALVALIAFLPSKPNGALGSLEYSDEERRILAAKSRLQPPKFGSSERQKIIDQIHQCMLETAPPFPTPLQPLADAPAKEVTGKEAAVENGLAMAENDRSTGSAVRAPAVANFVKQEVSEAAGSMEQLRLKAEAGEGRAVAVALGYSSPSSIGGTSLASAAALPRAIVSGHGCQSSAQSASPSSGSITEIVRNGKELHPLAAGDDAGDEVSSLRKRSAVTDAGAVSAAKFDSVSPQRSMAARPPHCSGGSSASSYSAAAAGGRSRAKQKAASTATSREDAALNVAATVLIVTIMALFLRKLFQIYYS